MKGGSDEALELISTAVNQAGYALGTDVAFALDVAASELMSKDVYNFAREGQQYTTEQLIKKIRGFID